VISVIESCVPAIKNAWHIPNMDINAVLVAIRIASYGHEMEVASTCPSCSHQSDYVVDMRVLLDQMRVPDYGQEMTFGDLEISFKPVTYEQQNKSGMLQFEQQKILSTIPDTDLSDEEKMIKLNQALRQITELTINVISKNISAIIAPGIVVTDADQIEEFLRNCDRSVYNQVRDHVINLNQETQLSPLKIQCAECEHQYEQPMNLDMASFFDSAS
jgi:bacterioferritin-associated ferredoxin